MAVTVVVVVSAAGGDSDDGGGGGGGNFDLIRNGPLLMPRYMIEDFGVISSVMLVTKTRHALKHTPFNSSFQVTLFLIAMILY